MAKILAIDEKNEILQRIKFVLERENNKVITAFGSEEGLDILINTATPLTLSSLTQNF